MSNETPIPRGSRSRAGRPSEGARHGRHLQLVTDRWITELAGLTVREPSSGAPLTLVRARAHEPRPDSAPPRLAWCGSMSALASLKSSVGAASGWTYSSRSRSRSYGHCSGSSTRTITAPSRVLARPTRPSARRRSPRRDDLSASRLRCAQTPWPTPPIVPSATTSSTIISHR
jgi:hypothetical protein